MKPVMLLSPHFCAMVSMACIISAQAFSLSAAGHQVRHPVNRRIEKSHHDRRPSHGHHYSCRGGRFFRVSSVGSIAIGAPFGSIVIGLPMGYREVQCGRSNYFYFDGVFYRRHTRGYVVVEAPRVRYIPSGARRVVVNDEVYFVDNDRWYCHRNGEYELCGEPVSLTSEVTNERSSTTIMIDNSNGSRTPIELMPMGANQWKGPRGEIYDGLPSENQLREAYGF